MNKTPETTEITNAGHDKDKLIEILIKHSKDLEANRNQIRDALHALHVACETSNDLVYQWYAKTEAEVRNDVIVALGYRKKKK